MEDRKRRNMLELAASEARKATFYRVLSGSNGNVKLAAANLGVDVKRVYGLMKEYGIVIERRLVPKKP